jgi:DNA repair exonuclease SbcCD nuclease subunit
LEKFGPTRKLARSAARIQTDGIFPARMEAAMTQPTLRLVHASDLHLERPIHGLSQIPDHLRDLLIEAPYQAAEQVFETALAEGADAVLLAGDVLNVDRAGPPAIVLLLDQLGRLADRGIPVYWAGGSVDQPDAWPRSVPLPENVHVFPAGRVENLELQRSGETIARVQGTSCRENGDVETRGFHRDAHGLFTIGVAYGTDDSPGHEGDRVHYMALGGRHQQQTVDLEPGIAHYCGSPQGRGPLETGPHGCTIVQVDDAGRAKTRFVPTDAVRWLEQAIEVTASTRSEQLHERMEERLEKLVAQHPGIDLLVKWTIRGAGPLVNRLRPNGLADELLVDLRRRFGEGSPAAWSVSIDCESPLSVPAEWYDEETVMGDLLRQFRHYQLHDDVSLDLEQFLPEDVRHESLAAIAEVETVQQRAALLNRAGKLGVDLLSLPLEEGDLPEDE